MRTGTKTKTKTRTKIGTKMKTKTGTQITRTENIRNRKHEGKKYQIG